MREFDLGLLVVLGNVMVRVNSCARPLLSEAIVFVSLVVRSKHWQRSGFEDGCESMVTVSSVALVPLHSELEQAQREV